MIVKSNNGKYKLRLTRCYLVEVIDKNENVVKYKHKGTTEIANDFCFGDKEDAVKTGNRLIELFLDKLTQE